MNNEIKEISDNIRKIIKSNRESDFDRIIYDCDSLEKLLDCITNLQEDLKYQKEMEEEYNKKHTKLMQDYSKLQEKNKKLLQKSYSDDVKITKAAEWVKKNMYYFPRPDELLNILNGEDNE